MSEAAKKSAEDYLAEFADLLYEAKSWMTPPRSEGEQDTVDRIEQALIGWEQA